MNSLFICILISSICLVSCRRPDKNPEFSDRIYIDMQAELRSAEQAEAAIHKKIEEAELDLQKSEPRSLERKNAANDLFKAKEADQRAKQDIEYIKIRLVQRKYEYSKAYNKAFSENAPWPPIGEFEAYIVNKKLRSASKNWSDRVPRPSRQEDPALNMNNDDKKN